MAISDDLNSIRTHLEDDYTALEQLGVSVEDKNIENIKDMANQIYAKFPKTDYAEGSNITLSNILKGKLDFEDGIMGYGQTSQKSYEGYNLLEITAASGTSGGLTFTINENKSVTVNGTQTTTAYFPLTSTGNIDTNTEYTLHGAYGPSCRLRLREYDSSNNNLSEYYDSGSGITFTSKADVDHINVQIVVYASQNNVICYPMLEKGDIKHNFEPYVGGISSPNPFYPQDVEVVRGKNVFGFANSSSKTRLGLTFTWSNSSITVNGTSTNTETVFGDGINLKPVKVEGTYKVSGYTRSDTFFQLYWKDKNGTIKYKELKNNPTITFNEGDTLYQLFFFAAKNDILTFNNETFNLQLEKGSTATSYLPYNTLEILKRGKNEFIPTLTNNGTSIIQYHCSVTLNDDEFIMTANNADMYFGEIRTSTGDSYLNNLGIKIYKNNNDKVSFSLTNTLFNKCIIAAYDSSDKYINKKIYLK